MTSTLLAAPALLPSLGVKPSFPSSPPNPLGPIQTDSGRLGLGLAQGPPSAPTHLFRLARSVPFRRPRASILSQGMGHPTLGAVARHKRVRAQGKGGGTSCSTKRESVPDYFFPLQHPPYRLSPTQTGFCLLGLTQGSPGYSHPLAQPHRSRRSHSNVHSWGYLDRARGKGPPTLPT